MDDITTCKVHNKAYQIICTTYEILLCLDCLSLHGEKGCKWPIGISTYASEQLVNKYKECLKQLEE